MSTNRKFNFSYFVLGILFLVVAIVAFNNPISDIIAITYFFGIVAIVKGIVEIFGYRTTNQERDSKKKHAVILGIVDIILGLLICFNLFESAVAVIFLFAVWFIVDSVIGLINVGQAREVSTAYFVFVLIINILGIVIGILLLLNPVVSILTIAFLLGFYFLIVGINYLIIAF